MKKFILLFVFLLFSCGGGDDSTIVTTPEPTVSVVPPIDPPEAIGSLVINNYSTAIIHGVYLSLRHLKIYGATIRYQHL